MPMKTGKENQRLENQRRGGSLMDCVSQFLRCAALAGGVLSAWRRFVQLSAGDSLFLAGVFGCLMLVGLVTQCVSAQAAKWIPGICVLLGVLTAVLGGLGRLLEGVAGTANMGIAYWNLKEEDALPYLMQGTGSQEGFFLLGLVLVFFVTGLCWYLARKGAILRSFLMALLVLIPGLWLEQCSLWGMILLFLGMMELWLYSVKAGNWKMRLAWTLLTAVLFLAMVGMVGDQKIGSILHFKNKVLRMTDVARFGEDTLPEGDLEKAYSMKQGDAATLRVTSDQEKALYLRGYTAGCYENGRWAPLKRSSYSGERTGFLKWLREKGFDPNTEYAYSRKAGAEAEGTEPEADIIRIQNLGASRKYFYTLYSAGRPLDAYRMAAKRDEGYRSHAMFGADAYEIPDYSQNIPGELNKLEDWMYAPQTEQETSYLEEEAVYREFVYDAYTEVGETFEPLIQSIFHEPDETADTSGDSVYAITQRIREKMEKNMVYSPNPARPEAGEDPLKPFLRGERVGNAAFFASAGVLAFRSFGIPARYAEGYLKERKSGAAGTESVSLTSRNSHAWVEVYMDGLGWVPIDVTPGYYYDTYALLQMSGMPDQIQKASVTEDQGGDMDNVLELQGDTKRQPEEMIQKIVISMVVSGVILLLVFFLSMLVTGGAFREIYEDWKMERLLARSEKEDTAEMFGAWIARQLGRIGIEMHVGWQCAETEEAIRAYIPEVEAGEYERVNELLEKRFYGDERLEPDETRVLYVFLRKVKEGIDKRHRFDLAGRRFERLRQRRKEKKKKHMREQE